MKKSNETLSATGIEQVRCTVEEALLTLIADHPEELPAGGPWWLEPDSTEAEVLRYSAIFGRDHLNEVATGMSHDQNYAKYSRSKVLVDVNGATGMIGMMLILLGLAERLTVIDHCAAAGVVAQKLAAVLEVDCVFLDITSVQNVAIVNTEVKSLLLLSSHAQNVVHFDRERDAALETQNQQTLQALATCFPNVETLSAISLEPARGARGLQNLLRPWQENFRMEKFCQIPVAKFGRGLRVGNKNYEAAILTKAMVQS
jgi:hypothetical protein